MEVTSTSRGKQALVFDGFRYRCHRKTEKCTSWVCVNDKKSRCPGSLKTTPNLTILSRTSHICTEVGTIEQEVIAKKEQCRKRASEELSVPVHVIFLKEFGELKDRGYDFVGHLPNYESMKSSLCSIRRKALGAEQNPVDSTSINIPPDVRTFIDGSDFLKIDDSQSDGCRILIFGISDAKNALETSTTCFLDGTFFSCPKQFKQVYTVHVDMGSTNVDTKVVRLQQVLFRNAASPKPGKSAKGNVFCPQPARQIIDLLPTTLVCPQIARPQLARYRI
ncbi:hypothetical protein GE061_003256 [Apolygus lucorum]|uniref:FLYWCH-type domain-containing protein n=1 Tax=Apolygus lucorum TaxID=248454 RepID=A0A6A4JMV7_APOLU|nr:hypothetical protein GE061_003256 [Apolygus lucorum]